jgi:hypothetical protein
MATYENCAPLAVDHPGIQAIGLRAYATRATVIGRVTNSMHICPRMNEIALHVSDRVTTCGSIWAVSIDGAPQRQPVVVSGKAFA